MEGLVHADIAPYPLVSVQSVRYRPVTVLKITNTDPANVQVASPSPPHGRRDELEGPAVHLP